MAVALLLVIVVVIIGASALLFDPAIILIVSVIAVVLWAVVIVSLSTICFAKFRFSIQIFQIVLLSLVLIFSVNVTHWPVRMAFAFIEGSLDNLADSVKAGNNLALPRRVGPFVVSEAGILPGEVVYLWTDASPGGPSGFVRCSSEAARERLNLWWSVRLNGNWQLVFLD
jgi:hypothetical protein